MKNKLVIASVFLPIIASANTEFDLLDLSLQELTKITVASKQQQTVYTSPSSVSVINRSQIQSMGIKNLQSLLNFIPGFQSTRDIEQGTANRISVRGRSTALSESVLIQIDGEKINDLYTGGISILNRLLDLGHVERIEIIRGPGSALYGSNAFLGVINIVTVTGVNDLIIGLDSTNEISTSINFNKTISQNMKFDGYFSKFSGSGDSYQITDLYGISGKVKDPAKGYDLYSKIKVHNWLLSGRYMQRTLTDFIALGSIGNNINKEETQQWSVAAQYNRKISENFTYNFRLSHTKDKWKTFALFIPKNIEIAPGFSLDEDFKGGPYLTSQNSKISFDAVYQINYLHRISMGTTYEGAEITNVYTATTHNLSTLESYGEVRKLTDDESFNDEKSRDIASIYVQDQLKFNDLWELTAGVRFDHYNDFGSSVNPRVALIWSPKPRSSLKFMYGTAFRAPNFLELYDRNNYADFGNLNLKAEEVQTTELSWLTSFDDWDIEITAFHNSFDQLITLGEPVEHINNPFFAPTFINKQNRKSYGTEAVLQKRWFDSFTTKILWNWFSSNSDINTARNTGAFIADYQWQQWHINVSAYFRGENSAISNQGRYSVADINIIYGLSESTKINISMKNIFNQQYKTQSVIYPEGIPNRGSIYRIEYTYQYN